MISARFPEEEEKDRGGSAILLMKLVRRGGQLDCGKRVQRSPTDYCVLYSGMMSGASECVDPWPLHRGDEAVSA